MKYLILILATVYAAQALTVQECADQAKRCKQYVAPMARNGNSREQFLRTIRTTPLTDICSAAKGFLSCNRAILDNPECNQFEQVSKYEVLYERLNKAITFTCDLQRAEVQRAIPCLTSRVFFTKISRCKRTHPCNSDESWNCAKAAVATTCDAATSSWFNEKIPLFKQNHPGCGEDSLMRKFYGAIRT